MADQARPEQAPVKVDPKEVARKVNDWCGSIVRQVEGVYQDIGTAKSQSEKAYVLQVFARLQGLVANIENNISSAQSESIDQGLRAKAMSGYARFEGALRAKKFLAEVKK